MLVQRYDRAFSNLNLGWKLFPLCKQMEMRERFRNTLPYPDN